MKLKDFKKLCFQIKARLELQARLLKEDYERNVQRVPWIPNGREE